MIDIIIRFVVGGLAVSAFAVLGDILRPKSFAGLFGAAPSIALATLAITIAQRGAGYAATEAHSMMFGAVALLLYSAGVCRLMEKDRVSALPATGTMFACWLICAFGLKWLLLGSG
jgi:uncharacterized membrane protein (GlpM family)